MVKKPRWKSCLRCGIAREKERDYYTLQTYQGEPRYGKMAQLDFSLCVGCHGRFVAETEAWEKAQIGASNTYDKPEPRQRVAR